MTRRHIETQQSCGHKALWTDKIRAPRIGQRIYCQQCADMTEVVVAPAMWHAKCNSCRWHQSRTTEDNLHKQIHAHLQSYDWHSVKVANYGNGVTYTVIRAKEGPRKREGEMSLFD